MEENKSNTDSLAANRWQVEGDISIDGDDEMNASIPLASSSPIHSPGYEGYDIENDLGGDTDNAQIDEQETDEKSNGEEGNDEEEEGEGLVDENEEIPPLDEYSFDDDLTMAYSDDEVSYDPDRTRTYCRCGRHYRF